VDPRAIAVQGIEASPLLIAVQGLLPLDTGGPGDTDSRPRGFVGFMHVNPGSMMAH
jgi:hypothetical protein